LLRLFVACALLLADLRNTREHCGEHSMVVVAVHSNPVVAVCSRDRTGEFVRIVSQVEHSTPALHRKTTAATSSGAAASTSTTARHQLKSPFHVLASDVSSELARTYASLEQLTKLAKSTSMYDDPAEDIQTLSDDIKRSLSFMRDQLASLQALQDASNAQVGQHEQTVVKALSTRFLRAKTAFLTVLETRKDSLKHQYEKKKQLFGSATPMRAKKTFSFAASSASAASTPLLMDMDGGGSGSQVALANSNDIAITIPERMLVERNSQVETRANALQQVQSTIEELSQIFERVGMLVAQQGELISRIEDDVERTETHVLTVREQLERALEAVMSSKWLAAKLGVVALVFLILFLVFFF
jgi:syntaxin 5